MIYFFSGLKKETHAIYYRLFHKVIFRAFDSVNFNNYDWQLKKNLLLAFISVYN